MPEKVHTKFGDGHSSATSNDTKDIPRPSIESTHSDGHDSMWSKDSKLNNGVKRMRDGSPKRNHDSSRDRFQKEGNNKVPPKKFNVTSYNPQEKGNNKLRSNAFAGNSAGAVNTPKAKFNGYMDANQKNKLRTLSKPDAAMLKSQMELPIWAKKDSIKYELRMNNVLLINGETGSGKSTQVPQYLCDEPWCKRTRVKAKNKNGSEEEVSVGGLIAITQPRRVAAISLAARVAVEMGAPFKQGVAGEVGYAVRFESQIPRGMKIKFVTEGILLQEMLHDPNLRKYSAIIVDEIHERSVDVDLIAGFLKKLVHGDFKGRGGVPLKVIIMSATLDLGGIEAFFAKPGSRPQYKPGRNHGNVFAPHLLGQDIDSDLDSDWEYQTSTPASHETYSTWEGFSDSDGGKETKKSAKKTKSKPSSLGKNDTSTPNKTSYCSSPSSVRPAKPQDHDSPEPQTGVGFVFVKGRQHEVEDIWMVKPVDDYLQEMMKVILHIHVTEPLPGDILAFLTGQDEIDTLKAQLEQYAEKIVKTLPRMKILPLYGSLPFQVQQEVFDTVKETFTRRIILATNIAETSVTVSGVRFVVDCGKSKVKQYRARLGMESLLIKPISKVSAIQRRGRAGREAKGKCYRLYTEEDYEKFEEDEKPEMLRSDVIEAVLRMKARGVNDVFAFPLMDSPGVVPIEKALLQLHTLGALDDDGNITSTGSKMASYPLPASYGRVLIAAAEPEADILLEAIDVISCFTSDAEVFLQPRSEEETQSQEELRQGIAKRHGDIITTLNAIQQFTCVTSDRKAWCRERLISSKAIKMAMQIRRQLRQTCFRQKLLKEAPPQDPQPFEQITPERAETLLRVFLKAFVMKTAVLGPDGSYLTTQGRSTIAIHPSSVLYGKKVEAIMFLEHIFTAKSYAKKVSAIQANWIEEALVLGAGL